MVIVIRERHRNLYTIRPNTYVIEPSSQATSQPLYGKVVAYLSKKTVKLYIIHLLISGISKSYSILVDAYFQCIFIVRLHRTDQRRSKRKSKKEVKALHLDYQ